jgi:serine phosphatase RsbU (regulator of sigma subunit)
MPRRGERLYLAVDAGPVFDESGKLIAVVETLRDVTEKHLAQTKVEEQASLLKAHFDEHQRETELARRILDHQIRSDLMQQAGVSYSVIPATNFSGDMVLAARAPSGRLYAILADATGHGLSAAVSVLPMVQEFYRLVEMSSPLNTIVESINFLLANSLPLGRFVAAAFVSLDEYGREGEIWVGGVPDVLLFDANGALERRFPSNNLPLGIMRSNDGVGGIERFRWTHQGQLLLTSDGIAEASDRDGVQFGEERLHRAIKQKAAGETLIDALQRGLTEHLQGGHAHDDMSMLVIDCPVGAA